MAIHVRLLATSVAVVALLGVVVGPQASAQQPSYVYETTIGGYFLPRGTDLTLDASGNTYVIGSFYENEVALDVVAAKIAPDGEILWTQFVIAEGHEEPTALVLDGDGGLWIAGWTQSSDFPVTAGAYDTTMTHSAAFLMKLDTQDGAILYSTFLDGDHTDRAYGLAINAAGELYVAGYTKSTDFPTVNAYQDEPSAPLYVYQDAFISKFSADGTQLLYSTYFGGYRNDRIVDIALDADENIVIAGETDAEDFPLLNPIDSTPRDLFVARLSAEGDELLFGTYFGGEDLDRLFEMELDSGGNVFLTGPTRSIQFPTTPGAYQQDFVGEINGCEIPFGGDYNCEDVFVTKLRTDGLGILFSTYLGGLVVDEGHGLAVGNDGSVFVTGSTSSSDFPGSENSGLYFISKLSAAGSELEYTFRRYSSNSGGMGITIGPQGDIYTTGRAEYPAELYAARLADAPDAADVAGERRMTSGLSLGSQPNPFHGVARIRFALQEQGDAHLAVYDATGRRVRVLHERRTEAGTHTVTWDGTDATGADVPGGVYFYKLDANDEQATGRTLLIR